MSGLIQVLTATSHINLLQLVLEPLKGVCSSLRPDYMSDDMYDDLDMFHSFAFVETLDAGGLKTASSKLSDVQHCKIQSRFAEGLKLSATGRNVACMVLKHANVLEDMTSANGAADNFFSAVTWALPLASLSPGIASSIAEATNLLNTFRQVSANNVRYIAVHGDSIARADAVFSEVADHIEHVCRTRCAASFRQCLGMHKSFYDLLHGDSAGIVGRLEGLRAAWTSHVGTVVSSFDIIDMEPAVLPKETIARLNTYRTDVKRSLDDFASSSLASAPKTRSLDDSKHAMATLSSWHYEALASFAEHVGGTDIVDETRDAFMTCICKWARQIVVDSLPQPELRAAAGMVKGHAKELQAIPSPDNTGLFGNTVDLAAGFFEHIWPKATASASLSTMIQIQVAMPSKEDTAKKTNEVWKDGQLVPAPETPTLPVVRRRDVGLDIAIVAGIFYQYEALLRGVRPVSLPRLDTSMTPTPSMLSRLRSQRLQQRCSCSCEM